MVLWLGGSVLCFNEHEQAHLPFFLICFCGAPLHTPPALQGNLTTRFMAMCLMAVARGWRAAPRWLQFATSWPVKKVSGAWCG